ncbi:MAG: NAD-dependent epimerase/dehydratase family protein [Pirellulaceae bacterium]
MRRLIVGCGYLGSRVAPLWHAGGDEVFVLTRSPSRARHFHEQGWHPLIGDVTCPETLPALPIVDTLLWSVGYDRGTGQAIDRVYVDGLRNVLDILPDSVGRVIYISSTGVYGHTDGTWVTEETICRPTRAGGQACWAAEQLLGASAWADRTVILRLAGIYGPHRLPRLRPLQAGETLDTTPLGLLNLIHITDAVQVVLRVADQSLRLPRVFLVADGHPVLRGTFYAEMARLWRTPVARFDPARADISAGSRSGSHKRVSNERMRTELGITLQYPSYRDGLAAIAGQTL